MILAPLICLTLAAPLPALAEAPETPGTPGTPQAGADNTTKMRDGLRLLFEGLSGGLDETLDGMDEAARDAAPKLRDFVARMGPALIEALGKVGDLANYEAPVVLPNGDILIKRKEEAPDYLPPVEGSRPDGSVDL